jgi:predicted MPP superfamily phosphohydrolase
MENARSTPIVRELTLSMAGLATSVRPLRLALLFDIHLGNRGMTPERLAVIVDQVNSMSPDLILLAGDFVTGPDSHGAAERAAGLIAPLAQLRAPLGVVAVLGNLVPNAGAYVSEADYFDDDWQQQYWGAHYTELRAIKARYDAGGLFTGHHIVGSV